jgi:hypothetical protein
MRTPGRVACPARTTSAWTWTLQVAVPDSPTGYSNVTLDEWILSTSY